MMMMLSAIKDSQQVIHIDADVYSSNDDDDNDDNLPTIQSVVTDDVNYESWCDDDDNEVWIGNDCHGNLFKSV